LKLSGDLKAEPTIIIDFGSVTTDIAVFDKTLLVASTINSGSDNLSQLISKSLRLTIKQADELKERYGIAFSDKQQRIIDAVKPQLENMVREIQKSVRFYSERAAKSGGKITQIVTVGGGAVMPGLSQYLAQELRLDIHNLEPWRSLDFGELPLPPEIDRAIYITAAGEAVLNSREVLA
jgi:Tfp pilus assembly PilM family ATPase